MFCRQDKYVSQKPVLERTIKELNGITCLNWDDVRQDKQAIFSTRSFGQRLSDPDAVTLLGVATGF